MKQWIIALGLVLTLAGVAAAEDGDMLLGRWLTTEGKAVVEFYKCADRYCGKIIWLKEPFEADGSIKMDKNNPKAENRNRRIIGLDLVKNFRYAGKHHWDRGKIYDPENGKTYACKLKITEEGALKVRGYIGIALIGRTEVWTRKDG